MATQKTGFADACYLLRCGAAVGKATRAQLLLENSYDFVSILGILPLGNFGGADHATRGFFRGRNYRSTKFTLATDPSVHRVEEMSSTNHLAAAIASKVIGKPRSRGSKVATLSRVEQLS